LLLGHQPGGWAAVSGFGASRSIFRKSLLGVITKRDVPEAKASRYA
jgi:hypothetical protein